MSLSPDSLPLSALEQIDRLCDSFEAAWRAGQKPRIEDYLNSTIVPRTELFRELLAREVELRKQSGENPEEKDYHRRFEVFADQIRTVLAQPDRKHETIVEPVPSTFLGPDAQPVVRQERTAPNTTVALAGRGDAEGSRSEGEVVVPERIGRFRPIRLLGRGNFLVFLARDEARGRDVAVKVARPGNSFSQQRLMSLAEEAQRLALLDHAGIVKLLEFVKPADNGRDAAAAGGFIVLEYVEGTTLDRMLQDHAAMEPEHLARIVAAVADAVHHAHTAGLVHRDLKPSNILIDAVGRPRVCDFGLAIDEEIQRLRRGEVAGTLPYMAPEQVRGETNRLDGRTDIWALGVILYRGLTGRLPFRGEAMAECFEEILSREPRPLRQINDAIPRELERICLRCLSRPMNERYLTAADLADDLRRWLEAAGKGAEAEAEAEPAAPAVAPRGLRTFGSDAAAGFLQLLPGPRGGDGLPESIRFWKTRIESREGEAAFSVGLIYGPSGGGKSSFVRAGLLPHLDRTLVRVVYAEATPRGTEQRLISELRQMVLPMPREGDLADAIAMIRDDPHLRLREKVLLVIDQFEQWLQARPIEPAAELVRALRHCDGRRVQVLLLVRDDFWTATSRFLRTVEIPLVEGGNAAAVELFDRGHARRVLEEFGRALGRLPSTATGAELAGPAAEFLDRAIAGLTGPDGRSIAVRLCLFVEVVRQRLWTPETLRALGGVEGIEVKFLEEAFDSPSAPPAHRLHREAAEAVLKLLLPPPGTLLRGAPRSGTLLREASGHGGRPDDFADLLRLLDQDLRLITPVDAQGLAREPLSSRSDDKDAGAGGDADADADAGAEPHYQLAHDFLIRPIREWLERNQRSTRAGRARLRLEAVAAAWMSQPAAHHLPSLLESAGILINTRRSEWSPDERSVMRAALRHFSGRLAVILALIAAAVVGGHAILERQEAHSLLDATFIADDRRLPTVMDRLSHYEHRVVGELEAREAEKDLDPHHREVVEMLLFRFRPTGARGRFLRDLILTAPDPEREELIRGVLASHPAYAGVEEFRRILADENAAPSVRLRAACGLAVLRPSALNELNTAAPVLARALVDEGIRNVPRWANLLGQALPGLVEPLGRVCREMDVDATVRTAAAEALAEILRRSGDSGKLAQMIVSCRPEASFILLRQLEKLGRPQPVLAAFRTVLAQRVAEPDNEAEQDELAGRQVLAAIALDVLGQTDVLSPLLRDASDPRRRALLIRWLAAFGGAPELLTRLAAQGLAPLELQALLMICAELPRASVTRPTAARVLALARAHFLDHPDPGVHSAAELVLRRWGGEEAVEHAVEELRKRPARGPELQWRVGPNNHTFAIFPGPLSLRMGSPEHEAGRYPDEQQHFRRIDRSLEAATREVTITQYRAFDPSRGLDPRYAGEPSCPVNGVSWYDAARYCNWLSDQEHIPPDQWCYPREISESMMLSEASIDRTGYRLPTESEWEYLCRAGTLTARPFGASEELLSRYAWTWLNSGDRARPVGQLLPNQFGMFDILGNLWEWCHDGTGPNAPESPPYPDGTALDHPAPDRVAAMRVEASGRRNLRGGAFDYSPTYARSAARYRGSPVYAEGTYGFRVVRTLPRGR